jgi:uncharacterized protein (DUF1501 family)
LQVSAAGLAGLATSGWLSRLAAETATDSHRKRSVILLWMNGGPSQMDTFDLKPGHANGGPVKEIETAVPGIKISEHLPKVAARMKDLAVLRSMSTKEGDHGRATFLLKTGNLPQGAIEFPSIGSLLAKELHDDAAELPGYVSISSARFLSAGAYSAGFLGPRYAPLFVGDGNFFGNVAQRDVAAQLKVQDLGPADGVGRETAATRAELLRDLEGDFLARHPGAAADGHRSAYDQALRLMKAEAAQAFDLADEPAKLRDSYGRNLFGQGCLLARRLVERGVPFVEVSLSNWDSHGNNFDQVKGLCGTLDPAWATLMDDLRDRGLLATTTVVWMGEFGRTPKINPQKGRDHFPNAWSVVLGGGGIQGGQVVGLTSPGGEEVKDRPISVADLLATVCKAIGVDHEKQNDSNVGRPIRIVDKSAKPVREVLS